MVVRGPFAARLRNGISWVESQCGEKPWRALARVAGRRRLPILADLQFRAAWLEVRTKLQHEMFRSFALGIEFFYNLDTRLVTLEHSRTTTTTPSDMGSDAHSKVRHQASRS